MKLNIAILCLLILIVNIVAQTESKTPTKKAGKNQYKGDRKVKHSFMTTGTKLPEFYVLVKTHKDDCRNSGRPIIANKNGLTTKLA